MNRLINLLLLVVMFFSIAHGVVLDDYAESDCSIKEYVTEFSTPHSHEDNHQDESDVCSTHYMFHISFLLPESFQLFHSKVLTFVEIHEAKDNSSLFENNTFRPPIA
ncbi:MAG: Unknown protein [uncultured Sulfurovum sp.]|uniref:Uncharacterized protein n=1 Tax=uncultured Sulfurovum sp. TaxID=269237 RepID=A0A6S6SFQ5_9BACT|nr:MAG: Unknown protein [uncultured Sulfurovum sp.]